MYTFWRLLKGRVDYKEVFVTGTAGSLAVAKSQSHCTALYSLYLINQLK